MGNPIQLSDSGTITAALTQAYLQSPQPLILGAQKLQARFLRQPIQIRGLKFLVVVQNAFQRNGNPAQFTPGAYVQVRIKAGRRLLTNDFVALAVLNSRINDIVEYTDGPGNIAVGPSGSFSAFQRVNWNFDRPMALLPGEAITCEFIIRYPDGATPAVIGNYLSNPWKVYVTAVGETLEKAPGKYMVPYATDYIGVPGFNTSQENDLRNVTGQTLEVRRLVGRSFVGYSGYPQFWTDPTQINLTTPLTNPIDSALLRVLDENNKQLMQQDNVIWSQAFPTDSLTWPLTKKLADGWGWRVQLPGLVPSSPGAANGWIPMIGLIGYREENSL
jgi:hypothetical protein